MYKHKTPPIPKPVSSTWAICGTIPNPNPPEENTYYNANFNIGVEAPTLEGAITEARKTFPTAVFTSCHHRGEIHVRGKSPSQWNVTKPTGAE